MISRVVFFTILMIPSIALADPVGVSGAGVYVTRSDCMALVRHHPSPDVAYQPGTDVHGKYVAPADLPADNGGFTLPDKVQFDLKINPMDYVKGQQSGSSSTSGTTTSSSKYANTAMPVARISVDLKTGQTSLNGRPLEGEQDLYVLEACRKAGFR
ncbi:hypothetical protein [Telmatospirillum siberiense]|uniref:Uncharacterized protein n=1 Tax=Telmatospirillum siberiense TaxID=382514 RepID=A0A2N3PZJ7_9PROT|nr:hypothetical protein [Telmatospirillum siberiense]PKU25823.1 hypothetical protein CWS72_04495 [Telmatospirillum siberiense]